jgi:hypothetical protein
LCIVTDKSTNIANYRIINTSIVTDSKVSIYHLNKEVEEEKIGVIAGEPEGNRRDCNTIEKQRGGR